MGAESLSGVFADPARDAARAFRVCLNTMARPGRIETITGAMPPAPLSVAAGTLLLTLCDTTTPLFLAGRFDTVALRDWLTFHTGAPIVGAGQAVFALGGWADLATLARFAIGTVEYPDRSTTLIVEQAALEAVGATLTGPGIKDRAGLNLPEIAAFRRNAALFPLGLDFYFTAGSQVAALPRSTRVADAREPV